MLPKKIRAVLMLSSLVFAFASSGRVAADDGSENKTSGTESSKASVNGNNAKTSASPTAALESEIQQLRDDLAAQQERISYLESQLHGTPGTEPASTSLPTSAENKSSIAETSTPASLDGLPQSGGTAQAEQKESPVTFKLG